LTISILSIVLFFSKSQSNSSSGNSNKNESSHSDQNIKKYMNDRVIPKITEIKKSIPTIEKLETALVDIKSGKANPVKINNIISRINDLKKLLEDYT
jgi:uncharacterized coiled-coil DUF342 family protein